MYLYEYGESLTLDSITVKHGIKCVMVILTHVNISPYLYNNLLV